jgi:predicted Fe-Mo cluster-binding NifX family protein
MLIAITAKSCDPGSEVDPRFGRAPYFHLIDTETGETSIVENRQSLEAVQGAGIQAAETITGREVETVLTGHCGPKAFQVLSAAGVRIVVGVEGSVDEVYTRYKSGEYQAAKSPDVESHWQ